MWLRHSTVVLTGEGPQNPLSEARTEGKGGSPPLNRSGHGRTEERTEGERTRYCNNPSYVFLIKILFLKIFKVKIYGFFLDFFLILNG